MGGLLGRDRVGCDLDRLILGRSVFLGHGRFTAICRPFFAGHGSMMSATSASVTSTAIGMAWPGVRSGSGSHPEPASSISAFSAISPFLRWPIKLCSLLALGLPQLLAGCAPW